VRESGGTALAVTDQSMVDGMLAIGKHAGVSAAPEGGAALVAISARRGRLDQAAGFSVLFNTAARSSTSMLIAQG